MSETFFAAEKLCYTLPNGLPLVQEVSFSLLRGEILAIAGANGAGKSTLLQLLAGLLKPGSGKVVLKGKSLQQLTPHQRAQQIAMLHQREDADFRLTAEEYIALGKIPHEGTTSSKDGLQISVQEALELIGLAGKKRQSLGSLSGGERQRVALARAVCQQPQLLLLDEPTNHLDPGAKGEMLTHIAELGITVITVLHDLQLIPSFADHVLLMQQGKTAACGGPVQDILTATRVTELFGVNFFYFHHPEEKRILPCMDIPIANGRGSGHPTTSIQGDMA